MRADFPELAQAAPTVTGASSRVRALPAPAVTPGMSQVVGNTEPPSHGGVRARDQAATRSEATVTDTAAPTVEELLEEGLHRAGASPVHLAIRGTPAADSVRCAWRGVARTAQQREDAIRFWLRPGTNDAIPNVATLEALFIAVLDALDPEFRETAKANFLVIARGGEVGRGGVIMCGVAIICGRMIVCGPTVPAAVAGGARLG